MPRPSTILTIARQDVVLALRQRWVAVYGAVLATLTLAVAYFGLVVVELTGWQDFERTAMSLLSLVLYIVPLGSMLLAVQSFRSDGGATDQLFAEPVTRTEVWLGKVLGLAVVQALACLLAFGFTGVVIGYQVGTLGLQAYVILVASTLLTGTVFVALGSLLSVLAGRTTRAYAVVLAAWFALVLLFDLLVIGVSFLVPELWANRLAIGGVLVNPVDAARVGTVIGIAGREMFGPAGAQLTRALGGSAQAMAFLVGVQIAWLASTLLAGAVSLSRQDL